MRQAATQSIQFVHDQSPDPPFADLLEQPVEFAARGPGPGNLIGINKAVLPSPLAEYRLSSCSWLSVRLPSVLTLT